MRYILGFALLIQVPYGTQVDQNKLMECHLLVNKNNRISVPYNYTGKVCGMTFGDSEICITYDEFRKALKIPEAAKK